MDDMIDLVELDSITERVIGCAYRVSSGLGVGFLEKVYENALAHEMGKIGLRAAQQKPIKVRYDGVVVGEYVADMVVEAAVIVELKVARELDATHEAQCMNYVRATDLPICLLLNFGAPKLQVRRIAGPARLRIPCR